MTRLLSMLRFAALVPAVYAIIRLQDLPSYALRSAGVGDGTSWPAHGIAMVIAVAVLVIAGAVARLDSGARWGVSLCTSLLAVVAPFWLRRWCEGRGPDELYLLGDGKWWFANALIGVALVMGTALMHQRKSLAMNWRSMWRS